MQRNMNLFCQPQGKLIYHRSTLKKKCKTDGIEQNSARKSKVHVHSNENTEFIDSVIESCIASSAVLLIDLKGLLH